jgi:hypothetical protein
MHQISVASDPIGVTTRCPTRTARSSVFRSGAWRYRYPLAKLGLAASITGARLTTITEVYPDSPRTTPEEECVRAQVASVRPARNSTSLNRAS